MFRVAVAIAAAGACTTVANDTAPDPSTLVSEPVFRCNVEPIVVRQCSYNACHGTPGTPLSPNGTVTPGSPFRVYSPGKLRASPPATIDAAIAPLTDGEHHANFLSASGFAFATSSVDDDWLLRKPLPFGDGGYEHKGGAIYTGVGDPQYVAIHDWLTGKGVCK